MTVLATITKGLIVFVSTKVPFVNSPNCDSAPGDKVMPLLGWPAVKGSNPQSGATQPPGANPTVSLLSDIEISKRAPQRVTSIPWQLPLQNLSGDSAQDYLADGLTEELVTDLAQLHGLRVISRTSSMRYKGTQKSLPEIARELNVDGVVEGSVSRSGERVRIHVQLIRAREDAHIWASTYEGDPGDVLGLQQAAAQAIAQEIRVRLSPEEEERLTTVRLINPAVHEAYLKGRYEFNQRTPESTKKSVAYFKEAAEKDPNYAAAYVALGEAYALLAGNTIAAPQDSVPKAKEAANRALALDPGMGEAHATLGLVAFFYDWDFYESEKQFRRGIELSPNYAFAHQWYGILLITEKRFDEAEHEFKTALDLDPLSLMTSADLAQAYFYSGRFDETIRQAQKIPEINGSFPPAHDLIGMANEQKGMYNAAGGEYQKYFDLGGGGDARMHLAHLYAVMGKPVEARKLLHEMENPPPGNFVSPYDIASVYAGLGEKEQTLAWMDRAYKTRAAMVPMAGIDRYSVNCDLSRASRPYCVELAFLNRRRQIAW